MQIVKKREQGFTLLEVIVVLIILVLLAAIATGRMAGDRSKLITWTDMVKSHLRYAQSRAMNTATPDDDIVTGIQFQTGGGGVLFLQYSFFTCPLASNCTPSANIRLLPGEYVGTVDLTGDMIELSASSPAAPFVVAFNRFGKPYTNQNLQAANALGSDLTLTLRDKEGHTRTITLVPETGFVP